MDPPKNNSREDAPSNKGNNNSKMASTLSLQRHCVPKKWEAYTRTLDFSLRPVIVQTVKPQAATMNHSYRDFSRVPPMPEHVPPHSIANMTFSQKVHHMLSHEHYSNTITWMPHGRAFKVLVPKTFEKGICPVYFGHTRYSSFLRDLNKFGYKHITKGDDRNCYYHEFMLEGRFHLCDFMPRCKDARRLDADPDNEPNFYNITEIFPLNNPSIVSFSPALAPPLPSNFIAKDTNTGKPKARKVSSSTNNNSVIIPPLGDQQAQEISAATTLQVSATTGAQRQLYNSMFTSARTVSSNSSRQDSSADSQTMPFYMPTIFTGQCQQEQQQQPQQQRAAPLALEFAASKQHGMPDVTQALALSLLASMQNAQQCHTKPDKSSNSHVSPVSAPALDTSLLQILCVILPAFISPPQEPTPQQNVSNLLTSFLSVLSATSGQPSQVPQQAPGPSKGVDLIGAVAALLNAKNINNSNSQGSEHLSSLLARLLQSMGQGQQDTSSLAALLAMVLIQTNNDNNGTLPPGS